MERFPKSSSTSSDFEFKYIPKMEFERMVTRVEQERKLRNRGVWGSFCSVNDEDEHSVGFTTKPKKSDETALKALKVLTDDDIQSVIQSIEKQNNRVPSSQAPFLARPTRPSAAEPKMFEREEEKIEPLFEEDSSDASSVHIAENVFISRQTSDAKFQAPNHTDDDDDEAESACSTVDGEEDSLQSEMLKLRNEIENANGKVLSSAASSVDLTYQETKNLKNIVDKTGEKIVFDNYNKIIDDKFDFLDEECNDDFDEDNDEETQAQTLPVIELRPKPSNARKVTTNDEFKKDSNVWIPQMQNQIRKSGREHEKSTVKKKRNDDVFPCDVSIHKAREVGKLKRDVNEKSQADVTTSNVKKDEKSHQLNHDGDSRDVRAQLRTDVMLVLGKITQYQEKICQYLDYLREIIEDPPEVEDMDDLKKRQKRATEFSNRFARNHLYQIGRIAEEIRLMPDNPLNVAEKVNFLFQVVMQAVQTYLKNVEMFIYNNYPDKLVVLIDFVINTMKICFDRMVFDKRDLVIQKMMRKCVDMKHYLEMNQQSFAKFASIQEKRKMSLASRSSFAFENSYGSKLSMYEDSSSKKKSGRKRQALPPKSPYDLTTPRNFQHSSNRTEVRSRVAQSRVQSQVNPACRVRRSSSNVSTAVQRTPNVESVEDLKLLSEKPLEDSQPTSQAFVEKPKEQEIMEMLTSIAKEQIGEMLMPFLAEFMGKKNTQQAKPENKKNEDEEVSENVEKPKAPSRVTSDVSVKRKGKVELDMKPKEDQVERVANNVQYRYVMSDGDSMKNVSQQQLEVKLSKRDSHSSGDHLPEDTSQSETRMKVVAIKPRPMETSRPNSKYMKQLKEQALKDRLKYVEQMMSNPLYSNETCNEPWKMFAGISDKILDEMLNEVLGEFDFGEKAFVDKFLQHELQC